MTAIDVVCQPRHDLIHVMTDGASYTPDGVLVGFGTKVFVEPNWPGIITGRGTAIAVPLLGSALSVRFPTFDALIDGIEGCLADMVDHYRIVGAAELVIAGFSALRGAPECYVIETTDRAPVGVSEEKVGEAKAAGFLPDAYRLSRLPDAVCGPVPIAEVAAAANYQGFSVDDSPQVVVDCLSLMIEMQRHSVFDDGITWVGGYAQLTTIAADGRVSQSIVRRWAEDEIGRLMTPAAIDWHYWSPGRSSNIVPFEPKPRVSA